MTAAQVAPIYWAEKFMECPGVSPDIKMRIRELGQADYALIRSTILAEYGPIEPVGYFLNALHRVKGAYGAEVSQQLQRLRILYDRAAGDHGRQPLESKHFLYPFVRAFPPAVSQQLERQLALVAVQPDPYRQLLRQAPVRPLDPITTSVHLAHSANRAEVSESSTGPCRAKRPRYEDGDLAGFAAALMDRFNLQPKPPLQYQRPQKMQRQSHAPTSTPDLADPKPGQGLAVLGVEVTAPTGVAAPLVIGHVLIAERWGGHLAQVCREVSSKDTPLPQPSSGQPRYSPHVRPNQQRNFRRGAKREALPSEVALSQQF